MPYAARVRNGRAARVVYVCSCRLRLLCFRCGTAAVLLLLLLLLLVVFCLTAMRCIFIDINYDIGATVQLFSFCCVLDVGKLNFRTSLCTRYMSRSASVHTKLGRCPSCDKRCCCRARCCCQCSSVVAGERQQQLAANKQFYFCVLYDMI